MAGVPIPETKIEEDTFPVNPIHQPNAEYSSLKVLFIHGGGSTVSYQDRTQEPFATYLSTKFGENFTMKTVRYTSDFEGVISTHAQEIARFRPDVVVGRSQGGPTILALIKRRLWLGPSVICCPALVASVDRPLVTDLPDHVPLLVLTGQVDEQVPVRRVKHMLFNPELRQRLGAGIELVVVDDIHSLRSVLNDNHPAKVLQWTSGCGSDQVNIQQDVTLQSCISRVWSLRQQVKGQYIHEDRIPRSPPPPNNQESSNSLSNSPEAESQKVEKKTCLVQ